MAQVVVQRADFRIAQQAAVGVVGVLIDRGPTAACQAVRERRRTRFVRVVQRRSGFAVELEVAEIVVAVFEVEAVLAAGGVHEPVAIVIGELLIEPHLSGNRRQIVDLSHLADAVELDRPDAGSDDLPRRAAVLSSRIK